MAQIIVMDGPGVGTTFELTNVNSIGRGDRCNIRLNSANLSEQQAMIKRKGGTFAIMATPPGSVLVNGQPVQQERQLVHGDMVTLADIMLLYGEDSNEGSQIQQSSFGNDSASSAPENPTIKSRQRFYANTESALSGMATSKNPSKNMETLLKVSNAIMSKLEVRELLPRLLDIIFEELAVDRGTVFLRDPKTNKLWPMASKTRSGKQTEGIQASRTIIREVLEKKEGILTKDAMEDDRFQMGLSIAAQQIHAALCVPMVGKKEDVLGIIYIDSQRTDRVFTEDNLRLVTAIAMQASLAIENALLVQQLGEKTRMEQELTTASNIQMSLLPKSLPQVAGVEVHGLMVPAKEVGGDYYDFVVPEGKPKLYICIGDVSGKGVPAGLVMVMARCFFRPLIISCQTTQMILEEMNKFLVEDTRKDMFMSMLVISWDPEIGVFRWTGAGHEHLILFRAATQKCEAIRAGGIVLGMMKKAGKFFKEQEFTLETNDVILLYTDGVTEAVSPQKKMFDLENVMKLAEKYCHLSAKEICLHCLEDLKRFMSTAPQHDDITLVAIKKI